MYCARCGMYHFGGSRCPSCGDVMVRGGMKFARTGEPIARGADAGPAAAPGSAAGAARGAGREAGRSEGPLLRIAYKAVDSAIGCALFTVALRCAVFLVQVAVELMRTGGDIEADISLARDIRQAIHWYEYAGWGIITVLIFIYRRNPR